MEKYLIDNYTVVYDERETIPYAVDSGTPVEQIEPLNMRIMGEAGTERHIKLYMPMSVRRVLWVVDLAALQSVVIQDQNAKIEALEKELEYERLPLGMKIIEIIRRTVNAEKTN